MKNIKKMFIDGNWVLSTSGQSRDIVNPANGQILAIATEGCPKDTEIAVQSAYRAFYEDTEWRNTTAQERSNILLKIADRIEERNIEFALLETMDNGKSLRESKVDVADAVSCFRYYAGLANKPHGHVVEVPDPVHSTVVREPIGVCALITPWNYPLLMSVWKMAPALAAGNTIVFKPSEVTPLTAIKLFEIFEEVGFPKGVVNLVLGDGLQTGSVLAASHSVDKVVFTGGTDTGRKIMQAAIGNLKKISLELGGKSPNIVFDDADFYTAIDYALFGIFANQGQVCSADLLFTNRVDCNICNLWKIYH